MTKKLEHTIGGLLTQASVLSINCDRCRRSRSLTALEAIASYGGLVTFEELRVLLGNRCSKDACSVKVIAAHRTWKPLD